MKRNRKSLILLIGCVLLCAGCSQVSTAEQDSEENIGTETAVEAGSEQEGVKGGFTLTESPDATSAFRMNSAVSFSEDGFYYWGLEEIATESGSYERPVIKYYDYAENVAKPLCNKEGCSHDTDYCCAYVGSDGSIYKLYSTESLFYYEDYVYFLCADYETGSLVLYRASADGSGSEAFMEIYSIELYEEYEDTEDTIGTSGNDIPDAWGIMGGYFYYVRSWGEDVPGESLCRMALGGGDEEILVEWVYSDNGIVGYRDSLYFYANAWSDENGDHSEGGYSYDCQTGEISQWVEEEKSDAFCFCVQNDTVYYYKQGGSGIIAHSLQDGKDEVLLEEYECDAYDGNYRSFFVRGDLIYTFEADVAYLDYGMGWDSYGTMWKVFRLDGEEVSSMESDSIRTCEFMYGPVLYAETIGMDEDFNITSEAVLMGWEDLAGGIGTWVAFENEEGSTNGGSGDTAEGATLTSDLGVTLDLNKYAMDDETASDLNWSSYACMENGVYFWGHINVEDAGSWSALEFYDYASGRIVPLCSRADCSHDDASCNAIYDVSSGQSFDEYQVIYYDGCLYLSCYESDTSEQCLYRVSPDGSGREKYMTLYSVVADESGNIYYPDLCITNGYVYYVNVNEATAVLRRMKLGGSKEEIVYENSGARACIDGLQVNGDFLFFSSYNYPEDGSSYEECTGGTYCYNCKSGEMLKLTEEYGAYSVWDNALYYFADSSVVARSLEDGSTDVVCEGVDGYSESVFVRGGAVYIYDAAAGTVSVYDFNGECVADLSDMELYLCVFSYKYAYLEYSDGQDDCRGILDMEAFAEGDIRLIRLE